MTAGVDDGSVDEAVESTPDEVAATAAPVIASSGPVTALDTAGRPRAPITVEQAYRARMRAAAAEPPEPAAVVRDPDGSPAAAAVSSPRGAEPEPEPLPVRPAPPGPAGPLGRRSFVAPAPPPHLRARPRIEPEQGILGLSRHTRSRLGSRLFNLFFVCVFALILVQMIVALLTP